MSVEHNPCTVEHALNEFLINPIICHINSDICLSNGKLLNIKSEHNSYSNFKYDVDQWVWLNDEDSTPISDEDIFNVCITEYKIQGGWLYYRITWDITPSMDTNLILKHFYELHAYTSTLIYDNDEYESFNLRSCPLNDYDITSHQIQSNQYIISVNCLFSVFDTIFGG